MENITKNINQSLISCRTVLKLFFPLLLALNLTSCDAFGCIFISVVRNHHDNFLIRTIFRYLCNMLHVIKSSSPPPHPCLLLFFWTIFQKCDVIFDGPVEEKEQHTLIASRCRNHKKRNRGLTGGGWKNVGVWWGQYRTFGSPSYDFCNCEWAEGIIFKVELSYKVGGAPLSLSFSHFNMKNHLFSYEEK